jgi:hypothetical protein
VSSPRSNINSKEICDVSDISSFVKLIMMGSLHRDQKLTDSLRGQLVTFPLSKRKHGSLDKVELLLKVIEADSSVDFVPVQHFGFVWQFRIRFIFHSFEAAVNFLIIKDVE